MCWPNGIGFDSVLNGNAVLRAINCVRLTHSCASDGCLHVSKGKRRARKCRVILMNGDKAYMFDSHRKRSSHGTLPHFSLQSSRLNICYYHQDLHQWQLHPGSRPRLHSHHRALLLVGPCPSARRLGMGAFALSQRSLTILGLYANSVTVVNPLAA